MTGMSVIIPVKNGADTLERCLQSIVDQTIAKDVEIIVLNSMSTDKSVEIAERFNAKIVEIPEGKFNHGLTRNIGVQHASHELIYLTVQDAWIGANDMLEKMSRHFDDARVMAVMGHQAVPHEKDKNPFLWYRPISEPGLTRKHIPDWLSFVGKPQDEQQHIISWDDVVAMYRREALMELPFEKTDYCEDWIWSYSALKNGWTLLHDSSAVVYHYHHQSFKYAFKSTYTINYHFHKSFRYVPVLPPVVIPFAKCVYDILRNKELSFNEKMYWIYHNAGGMTARYFSTLNFSRRLKRGGERAVDQGYERYCSIIPQGDQKNTSK